MSLKVTAFSNVFVPKTVARFEVHIPGILSSPLKVSATRVPQSIVDVVPLTVAGQVFNLPGKVQYPGRWSCSFYESVLMNSSKEIEALKRIQAKTLDLRIPGGVRLVDPLVVLLDEWSGLIPVASWKLKKSFLTGLDEFDIDWSKPGQPLVYKLNFYYNSIEVWHG